MYVLLILLHVPCLKPCCCDADDKVLEPKDGKVIYKDWDAMGSEISKLETFDDDEQPLPQNVSRPDRQWQQACS